MANKLYVIGIGGTGTRVLNSLTMILASGVDVNVEKIVPLIIDTDFNNGDLERYRKGIKRYRAIHEGVYNGVNKDHHLNGFFRTQIEKPVELNISGTDYGTLEEMVDYNSMGPKGYKDTKGLFDVLFNSASRTMDLEKGFLGVPNVGSVVLRNVAESKQFADFTRDFESGDRIFIISSIFGGTGAAGFPLLLNIFRDPKSELTHAEYIKDAIIGGVSVLPYFEVDEAKFKSGESAINSNTFITKTKAALSYYNKNLIDKVNALYFVGDTRKSQYENNDGGVNQKNPANIMEFIAATAALNFLDYEPSATEASTLTSPQAKFFEFGIDKDDEIISFRHFGTVKDKLIQQLVKFHYFGLYCSNYLSDSLSNTVLTWTQTLDLPKNFDSSTLISEIKSFVSGHYYRWLSELQNKKHGRKFIPFNLSITNANEIAENINVEVKVSINDKGLLNVVNEIPAIDNSGVFKRDKIEFDKCFNEAVDAVIEDGSNNTQPLSFLAVLNRGINNIFDARYKN